MKNFLFLLLGFLLTVACTSDDDICAAGEGTPRVKLKFKDKNNKEIKLPELFIDADYGSGTKTVISMKNADSVLVPLRVDGSGSTTLTVYTAATGHKSVIKLNYSEEAKYVSPPCGFKKLYHNITTELQFADPVTKLQQTQNEIVNEDKTHLYLIF